MRNSCSFLWCFRSAGEPPPPASVAIPPSKAQEFLARLSRTKRNIWDRSRPDVQQWIQQFLYLGFDEQVGGSLAQERWDLRQEHENPKCCVSVKDTDVTTAT